MPQVIASLGGMAYYVWPFTIYLLTSTIAIILSGKLSDIYGRKKFLITGIIIFITTSVLCGFSQNIAELTFFRGLQGIGGGILMTVSLIIVIKTANIFVDNLVAVGEAKGISQTILGVTASAVGTSLPEFGSAIIAILSGTPDIGVGVVIGSNIWNIAGILGISAFVAGFIKTGKEELKRDGLMTSSSTSRSFQSLISAAETLL